MWDGEAAAPSRIRFFSAPEREALFVVCRACSNCSDEELEQKIVALVSEPAPVAAE
jgi:hypothetical protein